MAVTAATPRPLAAISVADAMTHGVIYCRPDTALREVAAILSRACVHVVYVFAAEDDGVWGLVSDLDLVAAGRGDIDARTAADASVTPLVTVRPDESLDRASQLLAENGVSHLPVVDPYTGLPAGVLSTLDVARVLAA